MTYGLNICCGMLQRSIVQSVDAQAEAELQQLAAARLALADKGFVSSASEDDEGENDDDDPVLSLNTGPTSFATTSFAAQAEGQAVAEAERIRQEDNAERASKQAQKAERRRRRALKRAERERNERGERQPGTY